MGASLPSKATQGMTTGQHGALTPDFSELNELRARGITKDDGVVTVPAVRIMTPLAASPKHILGQLLGRLMPKN